MNRKEIEQEIFRLRMLREEYAFPGPIDCENRSRIDRQIAILQERLEAIRKDNH